MAVQTHHGAYGDETVEMEREIMTEQTDFETMMKEIIPIIEKHGYRNLGYQQTMGGDGELVRFIDDKDGKRERIDLIADTMDEEVYEMVMGVEE